MNLKIFKKLFIFNKMASNAIKRILNKDIKEIKKNKLNELGIFIEFDEENLLEAKAMIIGPEDSLYQGGVLFFKIFFPKDYPYSPPDICYISINKIRIHPNLYTKHHKTGHGKVCLSILGTWSGPKWTSVMDVSTILLTIQSILDKNPLMHEPGVSNNEYITNYNKIIEHENIITLFLKNSFNIPVGFEVFSEPIKENIIKYKDKLFDIIQKNINIKENIKLSMYYLDYNIDYKSLRDFFIKTIKI